ncbi:hypothetical protein B0H13DRAFT_1907691 [Mycena leptocephala]|nr:hypothetical protein B0H13DRAFT_1907691 [Mycena leptocephala]
MPPPTHRLNFLTFIFFPPMTTIPLPVPIQPFARAFIFAFMVPNYFDSSFALDDLAMAHQADSMHVWTDSSTDGSTDSSESSEAELSSELSSEDDDDMQVSSGDEEDYFHTGPVMSPASSNESGDEDMSSASTDSQEAEVRDYLPDFYLMSTYWPQPSERPDATRRHVRLWVPRVRSMWFQNYDTWNILHGRIWSEFDFYSVPHREYQSFPSQTSLDMLGRGRILICVRHDLLRHECPGLRRWEHRAVLWAGFYPELFVEGTGSSGDPYIVSD